MYVCTYVCMYVYVCVCVRVCVRTHALVCRPCLSMALLLDPTLIFPAHPVRLVQLTRRDGFTHYEVLPDEATADICREFVRGERQRADEERVAVRRRQQQLAASSSTTA